MCRDRCLERVCCLPNTLPQTGHGKSCSFSLHWAIPFPGSPSSSSESVTHKKKNKRPQRWHWGKDPSGWAPSTEIWRRVDGVAPKLEHSAVCGAFDSVSLSKGTGMYASNYGYWSVLYTKMITDVSSFQLSVVTLIQYSEEALTCPPATNQIRSLETVQILMLIKTHTTYSAPGLHPCDADREERRQGDGTNTQIPEQTAMTPWDHTFNKRHLQIRILKSVAQQNKTENNRGKCGTNQLFIFLNYISWHVIKKVPFPQGNKSTRLWANFVIRRTCAVDVIRRHRGLHHPSPTLYTY